MPLEGPRGRKSLVPSIFPVPQNASKLVFQDFAHPLSRAIQANPPFEGKRNSNAENSIVAKEAKTDHSGSNQQRRSVQLEEELTLAQLKRLMKLFRIHRPERSQGTTSLRFFFPKPDTEEKQGQMNLRDFSKALGKVLQLQEELVNDEVEELFRKVDVSSDGLVDWDELSSYILLRLRDKDITKSSNRGKVFKYPPKIVKIERSKEPTSRILTVLNPTRYITVSKDGIIRLWNTNLVLQKSLKIEYNDHLLVYGSSTKRYMKMWVTDAVTMENVHKMAVCTTNMDIYFYDMSTPVYTAQFHLCGLGAVSLCMDYYYNAENPSGGSFLFYGDDKGCVHLFIFLTPLRGLFETPFKKNDGSHTIFLQDLSSHSDLVTHMTLDQLHTDWVRRLRYYSSNDLLMSCSGNGEDTLVVRSVLKKALEKRYIYKVPKGIDCFDYSKEINIIATGGMDHVVRLWNPYVTIKPVATLKGHLARVIDVVIYKEMGKVFSYGCDTVLKIWDVKEHYCVQSIHLKYPSHVHNLEHGPFPVVFLPAPANSLLIACDDYLTELRLEDQVKNKRNRTSHERPICAAIYNAHKKQVITGCEGSVVRTWNVDTGKKVFEFVGVLGNDDMSCMTLEESGRRLFTGSRKGIVYIWNAGNGNLLHKCLPETGHECEVTAIQPLPERSYTLSVGWSRRILMYHDELEMLTIPADPSWKGGHVHEDDILCIAYCSPNLIATGSFDGDLILWSLERQNIFKRLKRGSGSLFKSKMKKIGLTGNRKRLEQGSKQGVSVDALLFLKTKAHAREQDNIILVSSQAGVLELWSMFGPLRPRGSFYAPSEPGSTVMALTTNQDNNILVSGDSSGYIAVWNIGNYCTMRLEVAVTKAWASPKRQTDMDLNEAAPPQEHNWRGHSKSVVSLEVISHAQRGQLILSSSMDCTAKLWTMDGDLVGIFGQEHSWDLKSTSISALIKDEFFQGDGNSSSDKKNVERDDIAIEKSEKTGVDASLNSRNAIRPHTSGDVIRPTFGEKIEKFDFKFTKGEENVGIARSLTEWSILGEKYNKTFKRRMTDRKIRRGNLGHVDTNLTTGGGLGSLCSPFQALHVPTANEFQLPRDLPMTPRMMSRSKLSPDETWQKNLTSLNLPPILPEDDNSTTSGK